MSARRAPGEGQVYARVRNGHTEYVARLPLDEWVTNKDGKLRRKYWHRVIRAAEETQAARRRAEKVANRALEDALIERESGGVASPERMTVAQLLTAWLDHCEAVLKLEPSTLVGYGSGARFWTQRVGGIRVARLTRVQLQSAVAGAARDGLRPATIRNYRAAIRSALNYAIDLGIIEDNAAKRLRLPEADAPEIEPFTVEEIGRFIDAVMSDEEYGAAYLLTIVTGLRQSEVLGLHWDAVDLDACTVHVRNKLYRDSRHRTWYEGPPKSPKSRRMVTFPEQVVSVLAAHRRKQVESRLRAGPLWDDRGLVFCNELGGPLHGETVTRRMYRLLDAHGLPRKRFHDLRHSHATALLSRGTPLETIRKRLGHADRRTTDIYAHVTEELDRAASDVFGAMLRQEAQ